MGIVTSGVVFVNLLVSITDNNFVFEKPVHLNKKWNHWAENKYVNMQE